MGSGDYDFDIQFAEGGQYELIASCLANMNMVEVPRDTAYTDCGRLISHYDDLSVFTYTFHVNRYAMFLFRKGDDFSAIPHPLNLRGPVNFLALVSPNDMYCYYHSTFEHYYLDYAGENLPQSLHLIEQKVWSADYTTPWGDFASDVGSPMGMAVLRSGGVVLSFYYHVYGSGKVPSPPAEYNQRYGIIYRRPDGTWDDSNIGPIVLSKTGMVDSCFGANVQHPGDNSVWTLGKVDSEKFFHLIRSSETPDGLRVDSAKRWMTENEYIQPYGEFIRFALAQDVGNEKILMAYSNNRFLEDGVVRWTMLDTDEPRAVTDAVLAKVDANENREFYIDPWPCMAMGNFGLMMDDGTPWVTANWFDPIERTMRNSFITPPGEPLWFPRTYVGTGLATGATALRCTNRKRLEFVHVGYNNFNYFYPL